MATDYDYGPKRPDPSGQTSGFISGQDTGRYDPYAPATPGVVSDWYRNWGSEPALPSSGYLSGAQEYGNQQAGNVAATQNSLNSAVAQNDRAGLALGIGNAEANLAYGTRWANTDAGFARRNLALEKGGLNVDVGANARQPGFLTALHNLALGGMNAQAGQQRRSLESNLTGRGAFTSVGGQQGRFDIASELLRQTQGENVNYGERMAQTEDQRKRLDLAAQGLGIKGEQLESDLQKGLERMGLDRDMTVADLFTKMSSSNLQEAAQAQQIYNDAIAKYSDYFSRLYPGQNAAEGTYGPEGSGTEKTYGGRR